MTKTLKPCPFCGSGAVSMVYGGFDFTGMHFASFRCGRCGAEGPSGVGISKTAAIADAAAEWNRREGKDS